MFGLRVSACVFSLACAAAPGTADAAAVAMSSLSADLSSVTFSNGGSVSGGTVWALAAASEGADGVSGSDVDFIPGSSSKAVNDGAFSASSSLSATNSSATIDLSTGGSINTLGAFGSSIADGVISWTVNVTAPGSVISAVFDIARMFDLDTDIAGERAAAATSFTVGILNGVNEVIPIRTLQAGGCDPNFAASVANGNAFANSCSARATFTFPALDVGEYTMTVKAISNIDVAAVPLPGAIWLFGAGVAGAVFASGKRKRRAAV